MCFFSFLRAGDVVVPPDFSFDLASHLAYGDVQVDSTSSPSYLEMVIKASKTDPFHEEVLVFLGRSVGIPRPHWPATLPGSSNSGVYGCEG